MPLPSSHKPLLPAFTHFWQKQANTRNFIDMPFDGILPPPSHQWLLTRILHHYISHRLYHNIILKSIENQLILCLTKLTKSFKNSVLPLKLSSIFTHLSQSKSALTLLLSSPYSLTLVYLPSALSLPTLLPKFSKLPSTSRISSVIWNKKPRSRPNSFN